MKHTPVIVPIVVENNKNKKNKRLDPPPRLPSGIDAMLNNAPVLEPFVPSKVGPFEKNIPSFKTADFSAYSSQEQKFLGIYLRTGSLIKAARQAYDLDSNILAASIGIHLLGKLQIPFAALMDAQKVSLGSLAKTIHEAQHAKHYVKVDSIGKYKRVADHNVRLKAAIVAGDWVGVKPTPQNNTNVQINNIIGEHKKKYDI